ncbi:carboxypeptidase-like regulatory domain-containing protein [Natronorubrum halophilum]|uniref:carboxypeptidase-like regulatory domain-containing protein n=1 Tax=Natronorubrum halophilum TaxID=1702106 RepID=UPI001EE92101|nr:carboxypeptidase-like regulatory domain-containing protein [Natronorubrum halophilum]
MTGSRPQTISIDDRARVPFAIIGVLLLVSSVMIVGVLESRDTPETSVDQTLAMDRTESAAQNELRGAVVAATHQAAAQPLMTSDLDTLDGDPDEVFKTYLKLLIYLEAEEALPNAGQEIGDAETTVSVDGLSSDPATAVGDADDEIDIDHPDDGMIQVSLEDVTITLENDDRVISERTFEDLTVTVGTPILELQEKTQEFNESLNEGFFEGEPSNLDNLAHKTAARLYPMAYFKSFINRMDSGRGTEQQEWTFDEILKHNHTEVMANDAIFGVQKEVFGDGTVDPYADRVMRPAWACLTADMIDEMAGGGDDDGEDTFEATVSVGEGGGATVSVGGERRGETDASGDVSFELDKPGTYDVVVVKDDHERFEQRIEFDETNDRLTVSLVSSTDRSIDIYDSSGEPIEGADVHIWTNDGLVYEESVDGSIDLEDDQTEFTLEIFTEGYEDYSETVAVDQSHAAVLTPEDDAALEELEADAGVFDYFDDPDLQETVCNDFREYIFGDKDGDFPDAPSLAEIIDGMFGDMDPLTTKEEVTPNDMADIAYYELIGVGSLSDELQELPGEMNPDEIDGSASPIGYDEGFAGSSMEDEYIDRVYDIDVDRTTSTSFWSLPTDRSDSPENYSYEYSEYRYETLEDVDVSLSQDWQTTQGDYSDRDVHSLGIDVEFEYQETSFFENTTENGSDTKTEVRSPETQTVSTEVDIDADLVDDLEVPESRIHDDFEGGEGYDERGDIAGLPDPDNFEPVVVDSLETLLDIGSLDPADSLEDQIEARITDSIPTIDIPDANESPEDEVESTIENSINGASSTSYDFSDLESGSDLDEGELETWLRDDLYEINALVKRETDPVTAERLEFLSGDSPFNELEDEVVSVEDDVMATGSYENVPDLIRMEVRRAYFDVLTDRIEALTEFHEGTVDDVGGAMSSGDSTLDDSLGFIQDIFTGDVEERSGNLEGSDLMEEMQFEVSGSPTYMDLETVSGDEVASVRPPNSTVMDNDIDGEHATLGARYTQRLPTPGIPLIPWPPALYVLQANSYNVDINGEYSRFEISATAGDPTGGESTTYVRDRMDVDVDFGDGVERKIGEVEPIEFDTSLEIVIVMPGLIPMQTGAPPNTGDPAFGEDIGFSTLLNALDGETVAMEEPVESDEYADIGPQNPDDED